MTLYETTLTAAHKNILRGLQDPFRSTLLRMCESLHMQDLRYTPTSGLRMPEEQARLWRQGRKRSEIDSKIRYLRESGCLLMAAILEGVGPQSSTKRVTNALPGQSTHNFGLACDFVRIMPDGSITWDEKHYIPLRDMALHHGLVSGGSWKSFPDWPHVEQAGTADRLRQIEWAERQLRLAYPSLIQRYRVLN